MAHADTTSGSSSPLATQHPEAYAAARELILAGVPCFVAPPADVDFHLPLGWQHTMPDLTTLDHWRPGWALAAVGGRGVDVIDVDPRNGGNADALKAAGLWPRSLGQVATPSGGTHDYVANLGCPKGKAAPGVDIQAGLGETSCGFVFLPPTVRISKVTKQLAPYVWTTPIDLTECEPDEVNAALGDLVRERVARDPDRLRTARPDAMFDTSEAVTKEFAARNCNQAVDSFAALIDGVDDHYNDKLNITAMVVGHYVPAFMTYEQAMTWLMSAAKANKSVAWQGVRSVRATVVSGLLAGMEEPYLRRVEIWEEPAPVATEVVDGLFGEFLTAAQLQDMPNPAPLINGVLDLDTAAWMIGKAGSYKSFIALDMLGHVALGKPWHGHPVHKGLGVYIVAEGVRGTKLRVAAWERTYGALDDQVLFLPRPVQVRDAGAWAALVAVLERIAPSFVVIDTQSRVSIGLKENDNTEMMYYVNAVEMIRRVTAACVLTLHHQGRAGLDARGASSIDGAQDAELRIERDADKHVIIHLDKQKDQDDTEEISLDLVKSLPPEGQDIDMETGRDLSSLVVMTATGRRDVDPDWRQNLVPNEAAIIGVFADLVPDIGGTRADIRRLLKDRMEMSDSSFYHAWNHLIKNGHIRAGNSNQRFILVSTIGTP